jgi:hypothetical protein
MVQVSNASVTCAETAVRKTTPQAPARIGRSGGASLIMVEADPIYAARVAVRMEYGINMHYGVRMNAFHLLPRP